METKILKAKIKRFLKITKPIPLTKQEKMWIRLIKCGDVCQKKYKIDAKNWTESLKPMFNEIYGWKAEAYPESYLDCMFNKLLDIYLKIQLDNSGSNQQIKSIISAGFHRSLRRDYELPIERVIAELCGQIQCTEIIFDGVPRFYLNIGE